MSNWVAEKIDEIGMRRMLQDMVDELKSLDNIEPYIWLLIQDLEMTIADYDTRNDDE